MRTNGLAKYKWMSKRTGCEWSMHVDFDKGIHRRFPPAPRRGVVCAGVALTSVVRQPGREAGPGVRVCRMRMLLAHSRRDHKATLASLHLLPFTLNGVDALKPCDGHRRWQIFVSVVMDMIGVKLVDQACDVHRRRGRRATCDRWFQMGMSSVPEGSTGSSSIASGGTRSPWVAVHAAMASPWASQIASRMVSRTSTRMQASFSPMGGRLTWTKRLMRPALPSRRR